MTSREPTLYQHYITWYTQYILSPQVTYNTDTSWEPTLYQHYITWSIQHIIGQIAHNTDIVRTTRAIPLPLLLPSPTTMTSQEPTLY